MAHSFTLKSVLVRKWRQKCEVASHVHTQEFSLLSIPLYSRIPHQWIVSLKCEVFSHQLTKNQNNSQLICSQVKLIPQRNSFRCFKAALSPNLPFFFHFISSLLLTPFPLPFLSFLSSFLPIHCLSSLSLPSYPFTFNLYLSFTPNSILPCLFLPLLFFLTPILSSLPAHSSALPFLVYHLPPHPHYSLYPVFSIPLPFYSIPSSSPISMI